MELYPGASQPLEGGQITCSRERTDHLLPTLSHRRPWRWRGRGV